MSPKSQEDEKDYFRNVNNLLESEIKFPLWNAIYNKELFMKQRSALILIFVTNLLMALVFPSLIVYKELPW